MTNKLRISTLAVMTAAAMAIAPAAARAVSVTLTPASLAFGSQTVGTTSAPQTTTLKATCDGSFIVCILVGQNYSPTIAVTTGFTQANDCPPTLNTLNNPTCTITLRFAPGSAGPFSGLLTTGTGGPTAALTGTGVTQPGVGTGTAVGQPTKCKKKKGRSAETAKKKRCKKKKK
jgi:hypothetical protein